MKRFFIVASLLFIFSCSDKKVAEKDLKYLNGYWEIQKVEFPNGQTKAYRANTLIDFIRLENMGGIRKKVQPKLDGTYIVSEDEESFEIIQSDKRYSLYYGNGLNERQEQLIYVDSLSFTTKNKEGMIYFYTRFQPVAIQP